MKTQDLTLDTEKESQINSCKSKAEPYGAHFAQLCSGRVKDHMT